MAPRTMRRTNRQPLSILRAQGETHGAEEARPIPVLPGKPMRDEEGYLVRQRGALVAALLCGGRPMRVGARFTMPPRHRHPVPCRR
jgi:hypothetical protein